MICGNGSNPLIHRSSYENNRQGSSSPFRMIRGDGGFPENLNHNRKKLEKIKKRGLTKPISGRIIRIRKDKGVLEKCISMFSEALFLIFCDRR